MESEKPSCPKNFLQGKVQTSYHGIEGCTNGYQSTLVSSLPPFPVDHLQTFSSFPNKSCSFYPSILSQKLFLLLRTHSYPLTWTFPDVDEIKYHLYYKPPPRFYTSPIKTLAHLVTLCPSISIKHGVLQKLHKCWLNFESMTTLKWRIGHKLLKPWLRPIRLF